MGVSQKPMGESLAKPQNSHSALRAILHSLVGSSGSAVEPLGHRCDPPQT